jgi:glycosyltransferase involved in cell wall biosynthesis
MKNKILIFFPHNIFINSAGCHTRCWSLISFFKKLNFDIIFSSFIECDIYPWTNEDISLSKEYFSDSLILSRNSDYKNIFLKFAKEKNISHVLINYYQYTDLISDDFFNNIIKICEIHDIIEHNSYMYNKVSIMIKDGFDLRSKKPHQYCDNDILKYDFIKENEIKNIKINNIEILNRYDLVLCISDYENEILKKNNIKNTLFFTYSKYEESEYVKVEDRSFLMDPIFVSSMNPFNLQSYFVLRDVLNFNFKVNIIGNISDYIDRKNKFNIFGKVEDLSYFYNKTKFLLCPITAGTGTKIKIIDSMLNAIPVITTDYSAKSTPIIDGYNGFISTNWDDFKSKSVELYNNKDLLLKFSKNSKMSIIDYISYEKNKKNILDYI